MAKRKPETRPDPDDVHRRILEHLERNPPPVDVPSSTPPRPAPHRKRENEPAATARPRLMLRRLRLEEALRRLESFLRFHCERGTPEIIVVVGRGRRSGDAGPVLGQAVREFCARRPQWVRSHRVAPPSDGGDGALILELERPSS